MWLIRALGFGFFLTSLKVIPSVLLERELKFGPLVLVEILESLVFNGLLIILSFNQIGIAAFTFAALFRSLSGVALIYIIAPWRVKVGIKKTSIRQLLSFGVPFQLNSILALLKDRLVPLVIARMIGSIGVGYVTWAQNLSFIPLEIMNIVSRITFPAFSRLQDDSEKLKEAFEKSIYLISLFFYPLSLGILSTAPSLIKYIVSSKWQPALPLIYLFSITAFWASLSTTSTNFLNAIGKIKITLKLMVMWTALEWLLTPLLTIKFNFYGVAFASVLISFTSILPIIITSRLVKINYLGNIWKPLLAALAMSALTFFLANQLVRNYLTFFIVVLVGALFYFSVMFTIDRKRILTLLGTLKND